MGLCPATMAGILACGSSLSPPSRPRLGDQWRSGVIRRLQLRGQPWNGAFQACTTFPIIRCLCFDSGTIETSIP